MLLNNFFYIDQIQTDGQQIQADIRINPSHAILKGHFPDQPVVPGVCMLEMLKEVIQEALHKKLQLQSASMIKFLAMFIPPTYTQAQFTITLNNIDPSSIQVNANLQFDQSVFLKFKGVFIEKK